MGKSAKRPGRPSPAGTRSLLAEADAGLSVVFSPGGTRTVVGEVQGDGSRGVGGVGGLSHPAPYPGVPFPTAAIARVFVS